MGPVPSSDYLWNRQPVMTLVDRAEGAIHAIVAANAILAEVVREYQRLLDEVGA